METAIRPRRLLEAAMNLLCRLGLHKWGAWVEVWALWANVRQCQRKDCGQRQFTPMRYK